MELRCKKGGGEEEGEKRRNRREMKTGAGQDGIKEE